MILYLIRHGRQDSTDCNVNVPLSPEGRRQAQLLGERMKQYPIDAVYSSDLIRAEQTARIAFEGRDDLLQDLQIRQALAEVDFGLLTGRPDSEVKEFYREYYQRQTELFQEGRIQRGSALDEVNEFVGDFFVPSEEIWYPEGESGPGVLGRLMPVVHEWVESGKKNIAVMTHGGVIRVLLASLFGGDFAKRLMFGSSLENCSITELHYAEEKQGFYLERFNDYAHLEREPALMRKYFFGGEDGAAQSNVQ